MMCIKHVKFEPLYHQKQTWGPKFDLHRGSRYIYVCILYNSTYIYIKTNMLVIRSHYLTMIFAIFSKQCEEL